MEKEVQSVRWVSDISGLEVTSRWDVAWTDLGNPVYSAKQQRMYFLFGDTFGEKFVDSEPLPIETNSRGSVCGFTKHLDFTDGIHWDGFVCDGWDRARELIPSHHDFNVPHSESSKIPQGGVEIDGTLYIFYESIRFWEDEVEGPHGWHIYYGGTLKSTDGGKTFQKVYDLSWVEPTEEEHKIDAKRLVEEDENLQPSGIDFDVDAHVAPGFGQMCGVDGKDGYIYVYGRYGGRRSGIKVGRVARDSFETFSEYEYVVGFDDKGKAIWKKGREGLDAIMNDMEGTNVIPGPCSNTSVAYNMYLQRWMVVHYKPGEGICYHLSKTPYGPYSEGKLLLSIDHPDVTEFMPPHLDANRLYGGFTNEAMMRQQGKIVPFVVCQWYQWPGAPRHYGSRLFEATFE